MRPTLLFRLLDLSARFERPLRGAARAVLEPRKPRHRVLRVVLALAGLALLGVFVVAALLVGAVMILGGLGWKLLRRAPSAPRGDDRVIDGSYRVVARPMLTR
jgi:hypothetical protein